MRTLIWGAAFCFLSAAVGWSQATPVNPKRPPPSGSRSANSRKPTASDARFDPLRLKAGDRWVGDSLEMPFRWCPPGMFTMGSPPEEPERGRVEDQVSVKLTRGFWLGENEVTQGEWKRVMGTTVSEQMQKLKTPYGLRGEGEGFPIYYVSHEEATEFARRLTIEDLRLGKLPAGWEYRLPTEAQWEYACRADVTKATGFGDQLSSAQANFNATAPYNGAEIGPHLKQASEVGKYSGNPWGFKDMHGNVSEWCRDFFHEKLAGGADPENTEPSVVCSVRGGGWSLSGGSCRSAVRWGMVPSLRSLTLGFRIAAVKVK